jgi:hypothetical protein
MPAIDLSILNQRQTPAFYADTLANRPSAGFVGRIFVSTDTFAFYRDNGTTWDLIGGPGTGTITGSGANGQVSYWNGASTITGSNDLFFDAVNGHLGVGTITPGTALDVKHDQSTVVQLEQETATNDTRIAFINSGVGLWRIGAFYNAGANDFGLFDIAAAVQPVTVKRTTGQVLIGTSTVGSGKLVVASATGDNGVQIVGASAPSLRIDNAESGPTKRAGLGISTATNNFIQGSADRDFCMFNGSTTASPILFGVYDAGAGNVQEAARISAGRNFLLGTPTDSGERLIVSGNGRFNSTGSVLRLQSTSTASNVQLFVNNNNNGDLYVGVAASDGTSVFTGTLAYAGYIGSNTSTALQFATAGVIRQTISVSGNVGIGTSTPSGRLNIKQPTDNFQGGLRIEKSNNDTSLFLYNDTTKSIIGSSYGSTGSYFPLSLQTSDTDRLFIAANGNVLIGTTTDNGQKLQVNGIGYFASRLNVNGAADNSSYQLRVNGYSQFGTGLESTGDITIAKTTPILYLNATSGTNGVLYNTGGSLRFTDSGGSTPPLIYDLTTGDTTISAKLSIGNTVTASVLNTVTNKVSIVIGGVQYYLLASTSAV